MTLSMMVGEISDAVRKDTNLRQTFSHLADVLTRLEEVSREPMVCVFTFSPRNRFVAGVSGAGRARDWFARYLVVGTAVHANVAR